MTTTSEYIEQYRREMTANLASPDWGVAKAAFMEANEWFDGETEIAEAATRRFRAEWERKNK